VKTIFWFIIAIWMLFVVPASAQLLGFPLPCSQAMIVGTWQGVFGGPYGGNTFACAVHVTTTGSVAVGACAIPEGEMINSFSGILTIDRTCHVTGNISFVLIDSLGQAVWQQSVSLWRSSDGSRLTGYQQLSINGAQVLWPFEFVAGQ
jgi:hypothetical protein